MKTTIQTDDNAFRSLVEGALSYIAHVGGEWAELMEAHGNWIEPVLRDEYHWLMNDHGKILLDARYRGWVSGSVLAILLVHEAFHNKQLAEGRACEGREAEEEADAVTERFAPLVGWRYWKDWGGKGGQWYVERLPQLTE